MLILLFNDDTLSEVKKALVDGACPGERFVEPVWQTLKAQVEVVERNELHKFAVLPKRWMVERSFA